MFASESSDFFVLLLLTFIKTTELNLDKVCRVVKFWTSAKRN